MTRLVLMPLLAGCVAHTSVATSFQVTPMDSSECVWVVRNNTVVHANEFEVLDAQGQDYLYLCCPVEGEEPVCLNPRWSKPSNNLRPLPSLEELEAEARRK